MISSPTRLLTREWWAVLKYIQSRHIIVVYVMLFDLPLDTVGAVYIVMIVNEEYSPCISTAVHTAILAHHQPSLPTYAVELLAGAWICPSEICVTTVVGAALGAWIWPSEIWVTAPAELGAATEPETAAELGAAAEPEAAAELETAAEPEAAAELAAGAATPAGMSSACCSGSLREELPT